MKRARFIATLMPAAIEASKRTGVDPRIIIAQAAQETGWGDHAPNNNYFGIKSHGKAGGKTLGTTEVVNGRRVREQASFRGYGSPDESVSGYADFLLENPRYSKFRSASGLDEQAAALQASGYATDPNYGTSVLGIARDIDMNGSAYAPLADASRPPATPTGQPAAMPIGGPPATPPGMPASTPTGRPPATPAAAKKKGFDWGKFAEGFGDMAAPAGNAPMPYQSQPTPAPSVAAAPAAPMVNPEMQQMQRERLAQALAMLQGGGYGQVQR